MEELDLIHLKDRQNYKMSGGEKGIAAIATILGNEPKGNADGRTINSIRPKEPETA